MEKTVRIAAIQMNADPARTQERLARADGLVAQAAKSGAQFVILPEVFNTGYEYSDQNYLLAESLDGPTARWMRNCAAQYQIHLAGSFLRRQGDKIFDTLLLAAPDGLEWRYDKNYPWFWERAYFQKGGGITVADTALGKIGLLICWDVAHPELWQRYAGKVELMAVSSCPPNILDMSLVFPDGQRIASSSSGALVQFLKRSTDEIFGKFLRRQAAWLGVPLVNTTGIGAFTTSIPNSKYSLSLFALVAPKLWKYRAWFNQARIETGYFNETYIADTGGKVLRRVPPAEEGYALSEVSLPAAPPSPKGKQPAFGIPFMAYLMDAFINWLMASEYKKKTRKYLGR